MGFIKSAIFILLALLGRSTALAEYTNNAGIVLQELRPEFVGENIGLSKFFPGATVHYLNDNTRSEFEIFFRNGLAYDSKGNLFDTAGKPAIFVMDPSGRVFASKFQVVSIFHHSSLASGKPVASAGEIIVSNGQVLAVNNKSGHYRPSTRVLRQFLNLLKTHGIEPAFEPIRLETYTRKLRKMLIEFKNINLIRQDIIRLIDLNLQNNSFSNDLILELPKLLNNNKIKTRVDKCLKFYDPQAN